ncbi:MAG: MlaD family protein [Pseudoflavonifractor sp.]|nr:MlaD family protein [Alloprevotella sp.]MCM1116486.1 MlaD family protein [Pseudoflavonifractor sp.]
MKKEITIGLSVIIALLVLFFGVNYLKGINLFKASNYYYASYSDVAGLAQSAPVTVNGYKVGLVRDLNYEYDNPGHVLVEMSLDSKLRLPQGTRAVLVTDMLGTSSIELQMGSGSTDYNVGDRIPGETAAGLMASVSGSIMPGIQSILPKVDSLLASAVTLASDPALQASVKRLDAITANLERTTALLSRSMAAMPGVTADAQATMSNVKDLSGNLASFSAEVNRLPLDSTFRNIRELTIQLNALAASLNSPESSLGLLLHDPELYRNLNASAAALDSLLIDVKRNPKRYISIKLL